MTLSGRYFENIENGYYEHEKKKCRIWEYFSHPRVADRNIFLIHESRIGIFFSSASQSRGSEYEKIGTLNMGTLNMGTTNMGTTNKGTTKSGNIGTS